MARIAQSSELTVIRFLRKNVRPKVARRRPDDTRIGEVRDIIAKLEELQSRHDASAKPNHSGRRLGTLLVNRGYLVQPELDFALARQETTGQRLGEIVVELGLVTEWTIVELIAEQMRIEVFDAQLLDIDLDVARRISDSDARRLRAVPIRQLNGAVAVAVADPTRAALVADLIRILHNPIRLYVATADQIAHLIGDIYRTDFH